MKQSLTHSLIWFIIFIIGVICYAFRFELNYVTERVVAVIYPSYSWNASGQITISRSNDGHFYIDTIVNGVKVKFMIDTGASSIALTKQDAENIGFDLAQLNYTKTYSTANGLNAAAPVMLPTMQIGDMLLQNIEASIGKGDLDISLLGMSLISRFKSFNIDKDLLILTY